MPSKKKQTAVTVTARGKKNPAPRRAKKANPSPATTPRRRSRQLIARRGAARHMQAAAEKLYEMNPAGLAGYAQMVVPAFASYAATRLASRIAFTQLAPRTKLAGHLSVGVSAAMTVASHFAGQHVAQLRPYDGPILLGSAIATLQSIFQQYLPKFGWIVSDHLPQPGMMVLPRGAHVTRKVVQTKTGPQVVTTTTAPLPPKPTAVRAPAPPSSADTLDAAEAEDDDLSDISDLAGDEDDDLGSLGSLAGDEGDSLAGGTLGAGMN